MNDADFIAAAYKLEGRPFQERAFGPDAFDCLGLSVFLARMRGVVMDMPDGYACGTPEAWNRLNQEMPFYLFPVTREELKAGDILEIKFADRRHLATYLHYGKFIHADVDIVRVNSISERPFDKLIKRTFRIRPEMFNHA